MEQVAGLPVSQMEREVLVLGLDGTEKNMVGVLLELMLVEEQNEGVGLEDTGKVVEVRMVVDIVGVLEGGVHWPTAVVAGPGMVVDNLEEVAVAS